MIYFVEKSVCPAPRTMAQWAEEEIVVPNGRWAGLPFSLDRQPAHRLLLREFELDRYRRFAVTGCTQSGKSLCAFVLPILYHLFELNETVCAGVPLAEMAHDKWSEDILPVLEQTRYKDRLPTSGSGSRGGRALSAVKFNNGAMLRFMSASGGDKARAGFTSRVLVATEVDGYDQVSDRSDESDKLRQMEGRLLAFGDAARSFLECTVTTEEGRIWQEYLAGTRSSVFVPCPECGEYSPIERENLVGWQEAETEVQAHRDARWVCLKCGSLYDEAARVKQHNRAVLVHHGQTVDRHGNVSGKAPETFTFSYRWTAGNNLFYDAGMLAVEEWREKRNPDRPSAERKMQQQFWTTPYTPPQELLSLPELVLEQRAHGLPRGLVPTFADKVYVGIDIHKRLLYWTATAFKRDGAQGHILDYGIVETGADQIGTERGIAQALATIGEMAAAGFAQEGGGKMQCNRVLVDCGWEYELICKLCLKHGFIPCRGYGTTQQQGGGKRYWQPSGTGNRVVALGPNWHVVRMPNGAQVLEHDTDYGKSWLQARFNTPETEPGSMAMFGDPGDHRIFRKHLMSEQQVMEKGILVWRNNSSANHWLDTTNLTGLGARLDGASVVDPVKENLPKRKPMMTAPKKQSIRRRY